MRRKSCTQWYNSYIGIAKAVYLEIEYRKSDLLSTYSRSFWNVRKTAKPMIFPQDVEADIYDYIENFYNRKRLHSYLGYMSIVEYRLKRYTKDCTGTYE